MLITNYDLKLVSFKKAIFTYPFKLEPLALLPPSFAGFNVILEILFSIVTFLLFYHSIKIFRIVQQERILIYGAAFFAISVSYVAKSFINLNIPYSYLIEIGMWINIIFYTLGVVMLAFVCLRSKDIKTFSLLLILSFLSIFSSTNMIFSFYLVNSILLIYVSLHYFSNYRSSRKQTSLMIFIAFLLLLFGKIHFIFSVNHSAFNVIGHMFELMGYVLMLFGLLRILKK